VEKDSLANDFVLSCSWFFQNLAKTLDTGCLPTGSRSLAWEQILFLTLQRPHRVYCEFPWVCIFILKTSLPFVDGDFYRGGIVSVAHVLLSILSVRSAGSRGSPVTPWLWAIPGIRMDNKIITHRQIDSS
jgi:hypothetical protein